jgi:glycosyltransferase involved in cell wall biosynthesis
MAASVDMRADERIRVDGSLTHRVLLVAPTPPPYGGMALQARQLENRLTRDGNAVVFFPSNFALAGVLGRFEGIPGIRTVLRAVIIWIRLWRQLQHVEVMHVLAASWLYFFLVVCPAVIVGRLRGRRVVLNYRGGGAESFFRSFPLILRPVFRLAHVVTAPSEFIAGVIRRYMNVTVVIVPNILDTRRFQYRQRISFRPRLLVTRHLEEIYDIESVLRAFRLVQAQHPEATLWIAGTGSQAGRLRDMVSEWGLRGVRFLGHVAHEELPAICDQCDIMINASLVDNFPGALIEASASGMVVVSTGAGGIPYIYEDEVTALLVQPGDWKALGEAVERVLMDQTLAKDLTRQAAILALGCDWTQVRQPLYTAYGWPEMTSKVRSEAGAIGEAK